MELAAEVNLSARRPTVAHVNEPPGVPSALGIEAVEWFARGDENLTVRVTGRWRRRRPALGGQPLLVIEAGGQRYRFTAMPEPPGLTGAAPGTWQLSFTVPIELSPPSLQRAWLQLGAVVVPLPVTVQAEVGDTPGSPEPEVGAQAADEAADPQLLAERRLRSSELALQATRLRATRAEQAVADLAARVEELERELDALQAEPARLRALLAQRDAARRAAEQRAHAERAMRAELQDELAQQRGEGQETDAVLQELALAHMRVAELETEIERLSRQAAEAEQVAASARVARERAEADLEQWTAARRESAWEIPDFGPRIAAEERLWRRLATGQVRPAPRIPLRWQSPAALAAERRLVLSRPRLGTGAPEDAATLAALRRELAARVAAEAALRSRLARSAHVSGAGDAGASETLPPSSGRVLTEALVELRAELLELRSLAETERDRRRRAETRASELQRQVGDYAARCAGAYEAIETLRAELERLRHAVGAGAPESPAPGATPQPGARRVADAQARGVPLPGSRGRGSLDPARLDAALARLRESAAAAQEAAAQEASAQEASAQEASAPRAEPEAAGPWLAGAFASLAERDGAAAGRLLLALLDAQGVVRPEPLAYDLIMDGLGCVQVSVGTDGTNIAVRLSESPRPAAEVQFAVSGDLSSLAALVASGSLRRRFGRRRARITGERRAAAALLALVQTPVSLAGLIAAGVRMDRWLSLSLAALMIDPAWTRGEHFSVGFQEPESAAPEAYLHIRDGRRPAVSLTPLIGAPATTIVCAGERVLPVLAGELRGGVQLRGDRRPMALLQCWIERAQSG